jgi:hypothetical protein
MSEDLKIIKRIDPLNCPCCGKEIFISSQCTPPAVSNISSKEEIIATKKELKERISEIKFANEEECDNILEWLDKEDTLLDRGDIDPLLHQIQVEQLEKIQQYEKEKKDKI